MVKLTKQAGIGHRFTEMLFGLLLAERTSSTYVFDNQTFQKRGDHGSYEWFHAFLPLSNAELTLGELKEKQSLSFNVVRGSWDELMKRNKSECGAFYVTGSDSCCEENLHPRCDKGCFGALFGLYNKYRWKMAKLHEFATFKSRLDLYHDHHDTLIIGWHIRTGDIRLNRNISYFETIFGQLHSATKNIPTRIYFIGENVDSEFPFLTSMCNTSVFSSNCNFPKLDAEEAFHHLLDSDVLITSGSSFAYLAAMLHKRLVINAFPKGGISGVYEVFDHGQINKEGVIVKPEHIQLRHQIQTLYIRKLKLPY